MQVDPLDTQGTRAKPKSGSANINEEPNSNSGGSKPTTPDQGTSPSKPPSSDTNQSNKILDTIYNALKKYIAPISRYAALIAGGASFASAAFFDNQNDTFDMFSSGICKGSLLATSSYGILQNGYKEKNTLGTAGYVSDIGTSLFASLKKTYFFRAIGSLLDQVPAMLKDISVRYRKDINEKYNKNNDPEFNFVNFKGFGDSFEKSMYGIKLSVQNTFKDLKAKYKSDGFIKSFLEFFNKKRADINILASSTGMLTSVVIGVLTPFEKVGRVLRDLFGFYADYAVGIRACSVDPDTGKSSGDGGFEYGVVGALYGLAGGLDIVSIFDPDRNWHYASLGLDRFAGCGMVNAQSADSKK